MIRSSCLLGTILLTGCAADQPLAPAVDQPPAFRATAFTESLGYSLDTYVYLPCAAGGSGEHAHLTGKLHSLFHVTISNSGSFVLKEHFQPQGVKGTGSTTGDIYQGTGVTQYLIRFGQVGFTSSYVNNFRIIGRAQAKNYLVHELIHLTVNANGTVTRQVDGFKVECR